MSKPETVTDPILYAKWIADSADESVRGAIYVWRHTFDLPPFAFGAIVEESVLWARYMLYSLGGKS